MYIITKPSQGIENIRTSQLAQSLLYKVKKSIFTNFPNISFAEKDTFLSIINEKEVDSEKLREFMLSLKSDWNEVMEFMYLTNEEIIDFFLYNFELKNTKTLFQIEFKNIINLLTKLNKETILKLEDRYIKELKTNESQFGQILWLNFNSSKINLQINNKQYIDILLFEKDIFTCRSLYININELFQSLFKLLSLFLSSHIELKKLQIYISDSIIQNVNDDNEIKDKIDEILEIIFDKACAVDKLSFLSLIVNNNLKYSISEKNFAFLKGIISKNRLNLEVIKLEGIIFNNGQKAGLCNLMTEYSYINKLKILNLDVKFTEEQIEKFNSRIEADKNIFYSLIGENEKINF